MKLMFNNMSGPLFMFLCYLFLRCNRVEGTVNLSREEDLELERQLKILNKPVVKTIKTDYGHIYDCVDFYKQPAFDHPLLKNHSYHFQSQFPGGKKSPVTVEKANQMLRNETLRIGLKNGGCPAGTVLIKRITKEDLIRGKIASKDSIDGTMTAIARTRSEEQYTGVLGYISLYNPAVTDKQYSAARMKVQNGNEFLEFGWRVDPTLYGDSYTHLFIQTNTNSAKCFDALCGFVVVSQDITPGDYYPPEGISVIGKQYKETLLRLRKESDGNWWLTIGREYIPVGYWPSKLFSELTNFATYADWGGEVYSPPGIQGVPQMGSGNIPSGNEDYDAYLRFIKAIDDSGNEVDPYTEQAVDGNRALYNVFDYPSSDPVWGHTVYFGGTTVREQ